MSTKFKIRLKILSVQPTFSARINWGSICKETMVFISTITANKEKGFTPEEQGWAAALTTLRESGRDPGARPASSRGWGQVAALTLRRSLDALQTATVSPPVPSGTKATHVHIHALTMRIKPIEFKKLLKMEKLVIFLEGKKKRKEGRRGRDQTDPLSPTQPSPKI